LRPTLKVKDSSEIFEVNNVYCIGKNYLEHIKEMETPDVIPSEPVTFLKPNSAVVPSGSIVKIPVINGKPISDNLQNETEIVVAIGKKGKDIEEIFAGEYIYGYAIGLDLTLRDIQSNAKKNGQPWSIAKGFYGSAPVSDIIKADEIPDVKNMDFELRINGRLRQSGNSGEMIFKINKLISYISHIFSLEKGDLIFTGTPEGISKLSPLDVLEAELCGLVKLKIKIG
jgi:2-keto-4-pentenoate hydratase/2-oxohepta-3-ene-1,7-dioic acid hydratase in catechol pathway